MSRDIDDIAVRLCAYWDSLVVEEASVAVTSERQRGSRVDGSEKRPSEETKSQGRLSDLARVHRRLSDERAGMKDAACARTVEIRASASGGTRGDGRPRGRRDTKWYEVKKRVRCFRRPVE